MEDDKVLRLNPDLTPINDVSGMVNLFVGTLFYPAPSVYLSFLSGPSFINGLTLLGLKPSLGFYFAKDQKMTMKSSYINIFNRVRTTKEDFGSLSLAIGLKLF